MIISKGTLGVHSAHPVHCLGSFSSFKCHVWHEHCRFSFVFSKNHPIAIKKLVLTILITFAVHAVESESNLNYSEILPRDIIVLITHEVIKNSARFQDYGPFLLTCKRFHQIGRKELNHDWALEHFKGDSSTIHQVKETVFFTAIRLKAIKWIEKAIQENITITNKLIPLHCAHCDKPYPLTPLMYATKHNSGNITLLLLKKDIPANQKTARGRTALHYAAAHNAVEAAEILLEYGAQVNAQNEDMETPLHYVAHFNSIGIGRLLINNGAAIGLQDRARRTALKVAEEKNNREAMALLTNAANAEPNSCLIL